MRAILETCDLKLDTWDTDHISDNWEQQYEQLHCDLWIESDGDSIRNSCDVLFLVLRATLKILVMFSKLYERKP